MQKYLACITSICLFFAQQNALLAQTDTMPPTDGATDSASGSGSGGATTDGTTGGTDGTTGGTTDGTTGGTTDNATGGMDGTGGAAEAPSGTPAPVEATENSGGGGGGSGAGVVLLGGAIIGLVVMNNKRKLEKTLLVDPSIGASLTQLSHRDQQGRLRWDMQFGSLSQGKESPNGQPQQQLMNWQLSKSFTDNVSVRTSFGFAADLLSETSSTQRRWLSADFNKTSLLEADDALNLSFGQVFASESGDANSLADTAYFSPALLATDLRTVAKNSVEQGRYINLSYLKPINDQAAFNLQWQYSQSRDRLRQLGSNAVGNMHVLLNWQYRY